jgi:hypothetical protein
MALIEVRHGKEKNTERRKSIPADAPEECSPLGRRTVNFYSNLQPNE